MKNLGVWLGAVLAICIVAMVSGCAGIPKVSQWTSPKDMTYEQVFNAALKATADNKFTLVYSDKAAGVISSKKQEYSGNKMTERNMNVQLKQAGDNILVSTKTSGSDFGLIEGALGGAVNKEITNNFFVYLFRQLNIRDPSLRKVVIADER